MNTHRRLLVNDLLRDLVADIRYCNRRLAVVPTPDAKDEQAYKSKCIEDLRSLWAVRHTCKLDRNGWPISVWGHFRLDECEENKT